LVGASLYVLNPEASETVKRGEACSFLQLPCNGVNNPDATEFPKPENQGSALNFQLAVCR
jgi:hypothetical protein